MWLGSCLCQRLVTYPRAVFPGCFYMVTRRCTQRQFLMRPDEQTNNAFIYCLAEAALMHGISIVLSQMMSNHHHTVIHDPHGRINEFKQRFHLHLAKCQNALHGRWENMWSTEPACDVELVEFGDVLDKLVYVATNPVKDLLVERVHHWPGPAFFNALTRARTLRAYRPRHFFRDDGHMPETVELTLTIPPDLGDRDRIVAALRDGVAAVEARHERERRASGKRVVGRASVLRQSWRATPTSKEPRRELRPRVAARSKWARIAALQRNREFILAYRKAREAWLTGTPIPFPPGTYWLQRFANITVQQLSAN